MVATFEKALARYQTYRTYRTYCVPALANEADLGEDSIAEEEGAAPTHASKHGFWSSIVFEYDYDRNEFVNRARPKGMRKPTRKPSRRVTPARRAEELQAAKEALEKIAACFGDPHDEILKFTKDIFSGDVGLENVVDPETGEVSVQVRVEATGTVEELLALNDRWHRELAQLDNAGNYCLLLVPRDESS